MGSYPLALKSFEKVIEIAPEIPQAYYYFALSLIKGRRLMTMPLKDVRLIEDYLQTAIKLDRESPYYKLLLALLKKDYYEMNGMRIKPPTAAELLEEISGREISRNEFERLKEAVQVGDESCMDVLSIV
jgi:tetratricopeptide (TPR) repeat protein